LFLVFLFVCLFVWFFFYIHFRFHFNIVNIYFVFLDFVLAVDIVLTPQYVLIIAVYQLYEVQPHVYI
jgi:hypothetical protein